MELGRKRARVPEQNYPHQKATRVTRARSPYADNRVSSPTGMRIGEKKQCNAPHPWATTASTSRHQRCGPHHHRHSGPNPPGHSVTTTLDSKADSKRVLTQQPGRGRGCNGHPVSVQIHPHLRYDGGLFIASKGRKANLTRARSWNGGCREQSTTVNE